MKGRTSMERGGILQSRMGESAPALFWGCLAVVVCAAMIPLEPSLLEEGMLLHFAQRMAHGEHLYRDLVFFSGPLPFELLSLLFRIFGEEVAVARWAIVALAGAASAASFEHARRAGAGSLAHVVAAVVACAPVPLFPLFSLYYYSILALSLGVLATFAALRGLEGRGWAIAAGCLASLVALTKQNVGIVLGPGLLLAVLLNARPQVRARQSLHMIGGAAGVAALTLGHYAVRGDLGLLVESMVVMPFSLGDSFGSPYINLWPIGKLAAGILTPFYVPQTYNILSPQPGHFAVWLIALTQLLYALPVLAFASLLMRRIGTGPLLPGLWMHAVLVLALSTQLFPRSDWGHLAFVLPPALGLLVICLGASRKASRSLWRDGVAGLLVLGILTASLQLGIALHRAAGDATFGPRAPQRALSTIFKRPDLGRAVDFLRARIEPGEAIFVARAEPLLYFVTDARNPTPFGGLVPGLGEKQDRIVVEALSQVRYVVMSESDSDQYYYYREELPETQRYLERHFQVPKTFADEWSYVPVLERGADRGATAIDLFDLAHRARPWLLDRRGRERPIERALPKLVTRLNRRPLAAVLGHGGGGIDFDLVVPPGGVFQAGLGVRMLQSGSQLFEQVAAARFEVSARRHADFELIGSKSLVLDATSASRWTPFELDLAELAGERVTLRLQVIPERPLPRGGIAWWGSPRLISRSAAEPEPVSRGHEVGSSAG